MKKYDLLTLGEVLMRLVEEDDNRLSEGTTLKKYVGGAELNVAVGAEMLGMKTGFISKIPAHEIGRFAKNRIQKVGVSAEYLQYDSENDARLGLYYYENGFAPRKPNVVYDRKNLSVFKMKIDEFPEEMYKSTKIFHTSGITLGLGGNVRELAIEIIKKFKEAGALISFDVNFRGNLWSGEEARECIEKILPYVDIFFCSESTANLTFKKFGSIEEILKDFSKEYDISVVAATQRIVHSPKKHSFGSTAYNAKDGKIYTEDNYEDIEIVDRIGSGDAYISGFLYGLLYKNGNVEDAISYGNAISTLKNTMKGDMVNTRIEEIEKIINIKKGKEANLEMNR